MENSDVEGSAAGQGVGQQQSPRTSIGRTTRRTGAMMEDNLSSTAHRLFVLAYATIIALAIMVATSCGVVTDYWHSTINGCILYADIHQTSSSPHPLRPQQQPHNNNSNTNNGTNGGGLTNWIMIGSEISVCNYATFTPVFFIFMCLICCSFHLRHLCCRQCWRAEESDEKTDFWHMVVRILIGLSSLMTLLALVVACVITHGHDYTCSGLRQYVTSQGLSPWMGISSAQIHELFGRLDCGFFYSALDYGLQIGEASDATTAAAHTSFIDSNGALQVAMATSWFQFFFWFALTLANVWLAHRMKVQVLPESVAAHLPALPSITSTFSLNKE